jgi:sugar phosphate isomerase/epimerase
MPPVSRRTVLCTLGAGLAAPALLRAKGRKRLPIAFSTLGCPAWNWKTVLDQADRLGYAAVELRGIEGEMDLTKRPELVGDGLKQTRRDLEALGIVISDLGASARMHEKDPAVRAAQLDEGRRFIDLAHALGAPYVRVFGNNFVPGVRRDVLLTHIARSLRELGDYAGPRGVTVLIESHGDFTDSPTLLEILRQADSPSVALLWDAHHTFVDGKEAPEDTVRQLGRYVRHTHLKDSVPAGPTGKERRYVLTGTGNVPVRRQIEALARISYGGYYSFEWEKRWHPTIEAPEIAIAHFATVVSDYLRTAGVPETSGR